MKDRTKSMLQNEVTKILSEMQYLQPGTNEYQAALEDLKTLKELMEKQKDTRFDKILKVVSVVIEGGKVVAVVASVVLCVFADQKGLFVSKLGLGMISKPRL